VNDAAGPVAAWRALRAGGAHGFVAVAGLMVVAGGLVATVNSAAPFAHGSWAAAYLVLVGGVAQLALALGRGPAGSRRSARAELVSWNAGNAGVLGGVLAGWPGLVTAASVMLVAALAGFARDARAGARSARHVLLYGALLAALTSSVVVGSVLAWVA
jgi:hypothetical protein